jgi:hypothetical protein
MVTNSFEKQIGKSDYIYSYMGSHVEEYSTGAFDDEYFNLTGTGTGSGIFGLSDSTTIQWGDDEEVSVAFDQNGANFIFGTDDSST